jgi:DinB superfamily
VIPLSGSTSSNNQTKGTASRDATVWHLCHKETIAMQTTELLLLQCANIHTMFHAVVDDLSPEEWTTRTVPETNLPGFDLWHVARTQDWALHTLVRGIPEVISDPQWRGKGALMTPGIGVGMTQREADRLAYEVAKADVLLYADMVHAKLLTWLSTINELVLDDTPDILAHYQTHPEYLTPAMQAEVPWIAEQPAVWPCLAPALGHVRDHLVEVGVLKRLGRHQQHP